MNPRRIARLLVYVCVAALCVASWTRELTSASCVDMLLDQGVGDVRLS